MRFDPMVYTEKVGKSDKSKKGSGDGKRRLRMGICKKCISKYPKYGEKSTKKGLKMGLKGMG